MFNLKPVLSAIIFFCLIQISSGKNNVDLPEFISSLKIYEETQDLPIDSIHTFSESKFKLYNDETLSRNKIYWLKITIDNKLVNDDEYVLHFKSSLSFINLFQKDDTGWIEQKAGILVPANERSLKGFIKDKVSFMISSQTQTILFVRINDTWGFAPDIADITILSATKFNHWLNKTCRFQFFFLGVIAVLCLFNFILYFFTKDKIYFYYSIYTLLAAIYFSTFFQITETGFFAAHAGIFNLLLFSITLNQAMYCWFLFQALKDNKVDKERNFIRKYGIAISLIAVVNIIIAIFNFRQAISLEYIYSIVNGLFTVFIFYKLFKKVSTTVRIILVGSLFVVIGGVAAIIINLYKVAVSHIYIYQTGFFIELIFFSVAINFMHYSERMEKLKARLKNSLLESERLKKEKEAHLLREEINLKNRDLTTKAVIISQKESFITQVSKKLKKLANHDPVDKKDILDVISDLNFNKGIKYWDEFETHFISVHPNFYKSLNKKYPGLTAGERKLCAFLKLNLSTKEIASVSGKSVESVDVARSRLRKKLGLKITENLNAIISAID